MKISETTYTINRFGNLKIPRETLEEMGLGAGSHVRVAYLTPDGMTNAYHEFLLSADALDMPAAPQQISVPAQLLAQANIMPDADIQVICIDGVIILRQESALHSDDLKAVLSSLQIASDLMEQLPGNCTDALDALRQATNTNEEDLW